MPIALKAQWVVTAGIVPGEKIDELTKIWQMTNQETEAKNKSEIFFRYVKEATEYAAHLQKTEYINWVNLEWIWF